MFSVDLNAFYSKYGGDFCYQTGSEFYAFCFSHGIPYFSRDTKKKIIAENRKYDYRKPSFTCFPKRKLRAALSPDGVFNHLLPRHVGSISEDGLIFDAAGLVSTPCIRLPFYHGYDKLFSHSSLSESDTSFVDSVFVRIREVCRRLAFESRCLNHDGVMFDAPYCYKSGVASLPDYEDRMEDAFFSIFCFLLAGLSFRYLPARLGSVYSEYLEQHKLPAFDLPSDWLENCSYSDLRVTFYNREYPPVGYVIRKKEDVPPYFGDAPSFEATHCFRALNYLIQRQYISCVIPGTHKLLSNGVTSTLPAVYSASPSFCDLISDALNEGEFGRFLCQMSENCDWFFSAVKKKDYDCSVGSYFSADPSFSFDEASLGSVLCKIGGASSFRRDYSDNLAFFHRDSRADSLISALELFLLKHHRDIADVDACATLSAKHAHIADLTEKYERVKEKLFEAPLSCSCEDLHAVADIEMELRLHNTDICLSCLPVPYGGFSWVNNINALRMDPAMNVCLSFKEDAQKYLCSPEGEATRLYLLYLLAVGLLQIPGCNNLDELKRTYSDFDGFSPYWFVSPRQHKQVVIRKILEASRSECFHDTLVADRAAYGDFDRKRLFGEEGIYPELFFKKRALFRLFEENFEGDGRFYGSVLQLLPKVLRKSVVIAGEETAELDFVSMHPSIAYALMGVQAPDNLYILSKGVDDQRRQEYKLALLISLNSTSYESSVRALRSSFVEKLGYGKGDKRLCSPYLRGVLDAVLEHNKLIAGFLNTGAGLKCMRLESDIAALVLKHFADEGILVEPVHDSFVIQKQYADYLRFIMDRAVKFVLGDHAVIGIEG